MTINEQEQTLTATREEFNTIIDKALDRKIKSLPDRSALNRVPGIGDRVPDESGALTSHISKPGPRNPGPGTREKILKTFRFFNAVAQNDHGSLR